MQTWWESLSKARSRILALSSLLPSPAISSLADSDRPARSLLSSAAAYSAVSAALSSPSSGSGDDPLCQWLYDTFLSSDPDLRLVVLSFLPLLSSLYLAASLRPSLAASRPSSSPSTPPRSSPAPASPPRLRPDLSLPPLPLPRPPPTPAPAQHPSPPPQRQPSVGVLCPPLEPQIAVKSTKRAFILAVAFDVYYRSVALMPASSKVDLCDAVAAWAGQNCSCRFELDDEPSLLRPASLSSPSPSSSSSSIEVRNADEDDDGAIGSAAGEIGRLGLTADGANGHHCNGGEDDEASKGSRRGARVPLPWELLQPLLRILGHSLLAPLNPKEVRDAASVAVRCVYARASHDLLPQAILAARSLIQLDKGARKAARASAAAAAPSIGSDPNTPSKPKKPEILLVSK
ncbi:hypothetical protein ACMD2_06106 [Ananas comosus]|uniref:Hyccin n=1 Tax=Ananas comosus TaxID=4615 RepID=A0A199VQX2_ANACO|nr:hypothetical protein ACMD2_06106 [Ananas comosus]